MSGEGKDVFYIFKKKENGKGKEGTWIRVPPAEEKEGEDEGCYWEDGVPYHCIGGMREMTRREQLEYNRKIAESEGYDVECSFHGRFMNGGISKIIMTDAYRGLLDDMAKFALVQYNKGQDTQLVLKHVQKANKEACCDGLKHYITFDVVAPDNRIEVFQAQVVALTRGAGYRVGQIRPKSTAVRPKPTADLCGDGE